ncbi:transglycosylase SLT domain-containing protein [Proteus mirabilis]
MKSKSKTEQAQLARYAFNNQWWDLAFRQRSPGSCGIIWKSDSRWLTTIFSNVTPVEGDPQSYAMAIARQESAWNCKVKSRRASGLMQLCAWYSDPYGEDVIYSGYGGPGQLLDPETISTLAPVICNMFISSLAITVFSPQQLITPTRAGANLAWQRRRAYRRSGICREYSVLRDAWLCKERAGL